MARQRFGVSLAVVLVGALLLSGCASLRADELSGVTFSRTAGAPGSADSEYSIDEDGLRELRSIFASYEVDPREYVEGPVGSCESPTTHVNLSFSDGSDRRTGVTGCFARDGSFEQVLLDFFGAYVGEHAGEYFPNSAVTSVTFRQSRSLDGFDFARYRQDDPAEIARFIALLDQHGMVWADHSFERKPGAIDPCDDSTVTHVTVEYSGSDLLIGSWPIDACREVDEFTVGATALFTEWRESLSVAGSIAE